MADQVVVPLYRPVPGASGPTLKAWFVPTITGGIGIAKREFPDVPGCWRCGVSLVEAIVAFQVIEGDGWALVCRSCLRTGEAPGEEL